MRGFRGFRGLFGGFRGLFNHILVNICLNDTFIIDLLHILVNICLNDTFVIDSIHILVNICFNGFGGGLRPPHPRPSGRFPVQPGGRPAAGSRCRPVGHL